MAKRLTQIEKNEIVQSFENGLNIDFLSQQFNCTQLTVIRNLKKNLGELKYKEIYKRNKSKKGKINDVNKNSNSLVKKYKYEKTHKDLKNTDEYAIKSEVELTPSDVFFELTPLDYEINNSSRKELSSIPISEVNFPKVAYMVVSKKIELEIKLLKDFPEWDFLPAEDLNRKTIEIFSDLNNAKSSCDKEQKVIKVPNTDVFRIAAPILAARGISRIVSSDNLLSI